MGSLIRLLLRLSGGVIGEQVQLLRLVRLGCLRLVQQFVGADAQTADQQIPVHNPIVEGCRRLLQVIGGRGVGEVLRPNGVFGDAPPVAVGGHRPVVALAAARVVQVLPVVAHGEHLLVGHQPLVHQLQRQCVRHLPHHQAGLVKVIGALEHLAGDDALVLRLVRLHVRDGAGLPAPGMVDQNLRVDPEQLVQQLLIVVVRGLPDGAPGDVPHGVQPVGLQLVCIAPAHPPEVGERAVAPQQPPVAPLIQLRDAHAVLVRRHVLGPDVHGHLGQIQVGTHARRRGDAGGFENVQDDRAGQLPGRHVVGVQVVGHVHEHLVDAVEEDVLRRDVFQVDAVDFGAPVDVVGHPWRGHQVVQGQGGVLLHRPIVPGGAGEPPARGLPLPPDIYFLYLLHHLKESGPAGDAIGFQGGGHGQADGLVRPPLVRHHQVGGHGVQPPLHALHRGVKALQVAADIALLLHAPVTPFCV